MSDENRKVVCHDYKCGWHGLMDEALKAESPFDKGQEIHACPGCYEIGQLRVACDEPGCWEFATCGCPTPDGYRQTCGKHMPK